MTKLYMRSKAFSLTTSFTVTDEFDEVRYTVKPALISMGRNLSIVDYNGNEVAHVRQKLVSMLNKYSIVIDGQEGFIKHKNFALKPKYEYTGKDWLITGKFLKQEYTFTDKDGNRIAFMHKKAMVFGECVEFEIEDPSNEAEVVAIVLAINCIINDQKEEAREDMSD